MRSRAPVYDPGVLRRLRIENLVLIRKAELELAPGLVALTGETGAGKTIVTQAIGLLLGAKADATSVGAGGTEAYVEAELDVPDGFFDEEGLEALRDLRPEDETGLVVARQVTADGRSRTFAWGRSVARDDVVAATDRLLVLSGQFAQRRLTRPAYRLDLLDAYLGPGQSARRTDARDAWRARPRRRVGSRSSRQGADTERERLAELEALVEDTDGLEPGEEEQLRAERGPPVTSPTSARAPPRPERRSSRTTATARAPSQRQPSARSPLRAPGAGSRPPRASCASWSSA